MMGSSALEPRRNKIAVVYLARCQEGLNPFRQFAHAYRRFSAGRPHDLVVVYKGYDKADDLDAAQAVFSNIPHMGVQVSDTGFDIGTYLTVAKRIDHDYLCLLNTFTEPVAEDWLALLFDHASSPRVGIVGAMGSYESIYDSFRLLAKVLWLCNSNLAHYEECLAPYFDFFIEQQCRTIERKLWWKLHATKIPGVRQVVHLAFHAYRLMRQRQRLAQFVTFPPFPNPHIRSTGFMLARERLLAAHVEPIRSKLDACRFESGVNSVTACVRRLGLAAVVVAKDGQAYEVPDWWRSNTFRLGSQEDLILADRRSREYATMSPGACAAYQRMTWGDYLRPAPPTFGDLDVDFAVDALATGFPGAPNNRV